MSRCRDCHHLIDGTSHDLCRTHSFCAHGPQYFGGFCADCEELWTRARNYESDPRSACLAWDILRRWVQGFIKNSKNRERGQDAFADMTEKAEFYSLNKIFKQFPEVSSRDSPLSPSSSHRVSVTGHLCWILAEFVVHFFLCFIPRVLHSYVLHSLTESFVLG